MTFVALKKALRQPLGSKLYSLVNVLGLAVGLACCLLMLQYVRFEFGWDAYHSKADRIHRVSREYFPQDGARLRVPAQANAPVAPALLAEYPEVEQMARIWGGNLSVVHAGQTWLEEELRFADRTVFELFDFIWLEGSPETVLAAPDGLVLTRRLAEKYFGGTEVLGRTLNIGGSLDARVQGVIEDLPANSHLSLSGLLWRAGAQLPEAWNRSTDFHSYLLLREGSDLAALEAGAAAFLDRHAGENASELSTLRFMKLRDLHLHSDRDEEWRRPGDFAAVLGFIAIGLGILLIACVNFTAIATARSTQRATEVGMRKVLGASRAQLVRQFMGEALLLITVTLLLAVPLAELLLPAFRGLLGAPLELDFLGDPGLLALSAGLALFAALVAGGYPSLYLARFNPALVLRGRLGQDSGGRLRAGLVVLQFAIAIGLIVSALVVRAQLQFTAGRDLGFRPDDVLVLRSAAPTGFSAEWPVLKQQLMAQPDVEAATLSHFIPFGFNDNQIDVRRAGASAFTRIQVMIVDYDFFETYRIGLRQGRTFAESYGEDAIRRSADGQSARANFVLNAAAARALDLPATALGSELELLGMGTGGSVVGVVDDSAFESARSSERPLFFLLGPPQLRLGLAAFREASVRVRPAARAAALAQIEAAWREQYPAQPFDARWLTEDIAVQYRAENRQLGLLTGFSGLAVLLACFGLFGLASFATERRSKEIGVRKVLGSGVWRIVLLLSNDFVRLVLVANLLAWPLAYLLMNRWLASFAYRIDLTPLVFVASGLIALCVAWLTVGSTAARAASVRPVLALRYE